ncbi:YybH family protein [Reichenbachiella sp.]|uniref:YybH family protein n=1 Tax=Reichenbachiella sp. TaxID=2184521 RepID=UPI003BB1C1C4
MKNLVALIITIQTLGLMPAFGQGAEVQSLKETYERWIQAWNDKDASTVAEIAWGTYGFGRDAAFLRKGASDKESYQKGIQGYMDSMVGISYAEHFSEVRIIDDVGFIDGYYEQTTQQLDGPKRSVYGRHSLVFMMQKGDWHLTHYHRSPIPNEFVR